MQGLLPEITIPDDEPYKQIGTLLQEASRHLNAGQCSNAELCIAEAKQLAQGQTQALAEIDFFCSLSLLEQNKDHEGVLALSAMSIEYRAWFNTPEGRDLYELVQVQRAFSLMSLERIDDARPLLEEAVAFQLDNEVRGDVHCQLGRCYHQLSLYATAKEQFERANAFGVVASRQAAFHYYFGYTLYELKDFQRAKREFILCLQAGSPGPPTSLRYGMLAAVSRKLGEYTEASAYEEKAKSCE